MVNIISRHNFLDPNDPLYRGRWEKGHLGLDELLIFYNCLVSPSRELAEGFAPAGDDLFRSATLRVQLAQTFLNVELKRSPGGFEPEWWREFQYVDADRRQLVDYPNDDDKQVRLMAYAPGPSIKGRPTLEIVSFDLEEDPGQEKLLASGPNLRVIELCKDENGVVTCVSENCREGKVCEVRKCSERGLATRTFCECVEKK
jgi:hypothetical protein